MASEFLTEKDKKTLDLGKRRAIYTLVRKHAGSHFREIERKCGLGTGTVQYHLDYLARHGLLKMEKEGNLVRYFPRDFNSNNKKLMGYLRQGSVRSIILYILEHGNCNHEQIVSSVGISPSTVSWHLKKLIDDIIISSAKKGRKTHYSLLVDKNELMNLLITYQESFFDAIVDNIVEMWEMR